MRTHELLRRARAQHGQFTRKRDGTTDYWVNLDCWRIEKIDGAADAPAADVSREDTVGGDEFDDEIPF